MRPTRGPCLRTPHPVYWPCVFIMRFVLRFVSLMVLVLGMSVAWAWAWDHTEAAPSPLAVR